MDRERKTVAASGEISIEDVVVGLARALGEEKARAVVADGCRQLGFWRKHLGREDVETLLDLIAGEPGLIGMTALLAKSRLHFLEASAAFIP